MGTVRLTRELYIPELAKAYFIGDVVIDGVKVFLNNFAPALGMVPEGENSVLTANFTFTDEIPQGITPVMDLLKDCADKLHDGDVYSALLALARTTSSYGNGLSNTFKYRQTYLVDKLRYKMLVEYIEHNKPILKSLRDGGTGDSKWKTPKEEMEKLYRAGDLTNLLHIRNCMTSAKSKYPEKIDMADYADRYAYCRDRVSRLQAAAKEDESLRKIPQEIMDKLLGGKFTKAQTTLLVKYLYGNIIDENEQAILDKLLR